MGLEVGSKPELIAVMALENNPDMLLSCNENVWLNSRLAMRSLIPSRFKRDSQFHDGSLLTAQNVKATYDKIIFPPEGVVSARQATYGVVEKVESSGRTNSRISSETSVGIFSCQPGVAMELHLQSRYPG